MPTATRGGRANVLLFCGAVLFAAVAAEAVYRMAFFRGSSPSYHVYNTPVYEFDSTVGYQYAPNTKYISLTVYNGLPVRYEESEIGPYGNLGNAVTRWSDDDFKILVFGDSFTAHLDGYHSWVEHIVEPLRQFFHKPVQVMNLARTAFGMKQMILLAAETERRLKADLMIVAFIVEDLDRACTWRATLNTGGVDRVFMTMQPSEAPDPEFRQDVALVEPAMTAGWCKNVIEHQLTEDPLLQSINRKYRDLIPENLRPDYAWIPRSFLYNRIRHGDATFRLRKLPPIPEVAYSDFRLDAEVVSALSSVLSGSTPVLFVLLPTYYELKFGSYQFFRQKQKPLYASLTEMTRNGITQVLDSLKIPAAELDACFLLPDDFHPTETGAKRYAQEIVKRVQVQTRL